MFHHFSNPPIALSSYYMFGMTFTVCSLESTLPKQLQVSLY